MRALPPITQRPRTRRRPSRRFTVSPSHLALGAAAACGLAGVACVGALEDIVASVINSTLGNPALVGFDPGPITYQPRSFVNWETPHVAPLALTPDRARLLAVNTPDASLEIFELAGGTPTLQKRVAVGLDPVTVRPRTAGEAWVVNHVSDSISIVDLDAGLVVQTLHPGDEPTDVAFAAGRAFVVCSQENRVAVYDLANLAAPPTSIEIDGEDPRSIALSPAGDRLYIAIFESGNSTTLLRERIVSDPSGPYAGENPIPRLHDDGTVENFASRDVPENGIIVRKQRADGAWLDENGVDWSPAVRWDLHDHDIAVIDVGSLAVSYISGCMNLNMAIATRPDGALTIVGTEALNERRFEPSIAGQFVRSTLALVRPDSPADAAGPIPQQIDLNPHLADAYARALPRVEPALRARSIADPRQIAWTCIGDRGFVAGMGSDNIAVIGPSGERLAEFAVGAGPTGLALDEPNGRLFVLNRFDATISTIDLNSLAALSTTAFFDPTPAEIREGRPFLYNAHRTSGLGVTACGSCHIDGRMDHLAWDLGDPEGESKAFNQECTNVLELDGLGLTSGRLRCREFHPLKGPLTTQTLQGIIGTEPLHWRGDRDGLEEFNAAFVGLNGADRQLTDVEMAQFKAFIASIQYPPNPNRNADNSLRSELHGDNPQRGREIFMTQRIDQADSHALGFNEVVSGALDQVGPVRTCNSCHQLPTGTDGSITPGAALTTTQDVKVPQLRNMHEKTGFSKIAPSKRGFGFAHDGKHATLEDFLSITVFEFGDGQSGMQNRRDVVSFLLSFSEDTHAGVGQQVTIDARTIADPAVAARLASLRAIAETRQVGLIVTGRLDGAIGAFAFAGDSSFTSASGATVAAARLASPANDDLLTWTLVPLGSEARLAADRGSR